MTEQTQAEFWNGEPGERWANYAEALDIMLDPFVAPILAEADLQSGERVVDIGCGAGVLSARAARQVGASGHVIGVDVSKPILDAANARYGSEPNIQFELADAAIWAPDTPVDVLISRFGVMFFETPVDAFRNLHSAMTPGGRMAFACWRSMPENAWAAMIIKTLMPLLQTPPAPPPPGAPGPFAFADPAYVEGILGDAGWSNITLKPVDSEIMLPGETSAEMVRFAKEMGPVSRMISESGLDESIVDEHLTAFFASKAGADGRVRLPAAVWLVKADA